MIRENKEPMDKNGRKHGLSEYYHDNGQLFYKGNYIHGKRYGYHDLYFYGGELFYREYYYIGELLYITSKNKLLI